MMNLATTDPEAWDKLLSGQAGFILATILFGMFFWKVLLPRWDKQIEAFGAHTKEITKLANAVRVIATERLRASHADAATIEREIKEMDTEI